MQLPELGCKKSDLDTPWLCVDLDVMERNIASIVAKCKEHGIDWRPHTKSHKSPAIAHQLIDAGALGVTCAKLGEAEVMAAGGVKEILVANLIVGKHKVARLVELRRKVDPIIVVDNAEQVNPIAEAMAAAGLTCRLMIEVDIGLGRVGVQPGEPTVALAQLIHDSPGVTLAGIMGYEGHLLRVEDPKQKASQISAALCVLTDTADAIRTAGVPCEIVSCGGTGSFKYSVTQPGITELQAGGGMFMDAFYRHGCDVTEWDYAMTVVAQVVSRPAPDRAIMDAGRKTMDPSTTPLVVGRDDITVGALSAEHGELLLAPSAQDLKIGDRLEIIPGYSDMTCVLHNHILGFRGDKLETIFEIEGRGWLR